VLGVKREVGVEVVAPLPTNAHEAKVIRRGG
jgi:hypothetical protein